MRALEYLEDAWGKYLEALRALIVGPVVVIVDDTFDHKLYSRVEDVSRYGNYFAWCSMHKGYESGVQVLTVALHDLGTGRSYMVGAFPYTRKMWESGQVKEFRTKIEIAEMIEVLNPIPRGKGGVRLLVLVGELVKGNVVSELKSNRRLLRVRSEGKDALEVEGHLQRVSRTQIIE
ncbi:hypothetical protein [Metallosphaera hakonensis]|uniref:hypothetical protein n=1 Tax=Metallosphaera hakonensis TaxID=79601 RepID=UPI0014436973|nr:hypothetical protein [Metallosphaera hakonensis]